MPVEKESDVRKIEKSGIVAGAAPRVGDKRVLEEGGLEPRLQEILKKYASDQGMTCGDLLKKCRVDWRRGLAVIQKLEKPEAGAQDVQGFVYDLWKKGLVFTEPPEKGKKAARIWSMEAARIKFPLACPASGEAILVVQSLTQESLKSAYDKFVPEHLGGFVPLFKVRRELAVPRVEFDNFVKSLNEMDDPVLELLGGDPQSFTEDQKQDSLWRGENLFFRMRWRRQ